MARLLIYLAVCILLLGSAGYATTITFTENGFTDPPTTSKLLTGNEWQNLGILVSNVYWYADLRDPFDQRGISPLASNPGRVDFLDPISLLSFDWMALPGNAFFLEAHKADGSLVDSFSAAGASGTQSGTNSVSGPISYILFHDDGGRVTLSTLTFDSPTNVPEPGTLLLLSCGLVGLGLVSRRKGN